MQINQKHWKLRKFELITHIRLIVLLTLFTLLFIKNFQTEEIYNTKLINFLVIFIYFGIIIAIVFLSWHQKKGSMKICIDNEKCIINISRTACRDRVIYFNEIKSLELYSLCKESPQTLVIGVRNKGSAILEKRKFQDEDDFLDFIVNLKKSMSCHENYNIAVDSIENIETKKRIHDYVVVFSVFFLLVYFYLSETNFQSLGSDAILYGALDKQNGFPEIYRLASAFFLHINPLHLGINILFLATVGEYVIRTLGPVRFTNILLFSGISGAISSIAFSPYPTVIGASGGLMGLLGAYFILCMKVTDQLPGSISSSRKAIIGVLIFQILIDLLFPIVDISSHLGGFVFGFLYTLILLKHNNEKITITKIKKVEYWLYVIVSCFFIACFLIFAKFL